MYTIYIDFIKINKLIYFYIYFNILKKILNLYITKKKKNI